MLLSADAGTVEELLDTRAFNFASAPIASAAEVSTTPSTVQSAPKIDFSDLNTTEAGAATLRRLVSKVEDGPVVLSRSAMILRDQDGNIMSSFGPGYSSLDPTHPNASDGSGPVDPDQAIKDLELTPGGLASLPRLPWSQDYSFKAELPADQGWMTFTIPVGPNTNSMRLDVRPNFDDGSAIPARVDQVYLLNSDGHLLASITGIAEVTTESKQTLFLTLESAPSGGWMVVRMVASVASPHTDSDTSPDTPESSSSPADGGGFGSSTPAGASASIAFMVDIHRNDGLSTMVGGSPASPPAALPPGVYGNATTDVGFGGLGTVSVASPPGGVSSVEPGYALNTSNRSTTYVGGRSVPASTVSMEMEPEAEPISLGPLVSRSAAPIGPALATSVDDPAPSISRDEQGGRELDLVRLKGEAGDLESELRIGEANGRASGRRLGEGGGSPLIALMAPGGLPSLVASFPGGSDRSQAEALAATLQPPADLADAGRRLPNSPDDWSRQQEDVARAGVASRAVGFVVALGLASGPLYPDLIAFARRRLTRRRVSAGPLIRRRFRGSIV